MKRVALLSLLVSCYGFGQDPDVPFATGNPDRLYEMQVGTVYKDVPINGTPYLDEQYRMGVTAVHGKEINLLMRYDAYNDQVEMIDKNQKKFNLLRRPDLTASFEGRTYKLMDYRENGEKAQGYFNPLNNGDMVLYWKPKKTLVQAKKPDHGYDIYTPPHYREEHAYYMGKGNTILGKVRLTRGQIVKYLRDHSREVKEYISENKLDLKREKDVIAVLNYYNSLN